MTKKSNKTNTTPVLNPSDDIEPIDQFSERLKDFDLDSVRRQVAIDTAKRLGCDPDGLEKMLEAHGF